MFSDWKQGWLRTITQKRIILICYLINLTVLLLSLIPFAILHAQFGGSSFLINDGFDNFHYFADITQHQSIAFTLSIVSMGIGLILFLIINLLLSGGVLSELKSGRTYQSSIFWGGAFEWFVPFIRFGLWSLIYLGFFIISVVLLISAVEWLVGDDPYQYWLFWLDWIKLCLIALAFFVWRTLYEWGRVMMLKHEEKRSRRIFIQVLRNVFRHKALWSVAILNFGVGLLALLLYIWLKSVMGNSFATLFIAQLYIIVRIAIRLAVYGGMWSLPVRAG